MFRKLAMPMTMRMLLGKCVELEPEHFPIKVALELRTQAFLFGIRREPRDWSFEEVQQSPFLQGAIKQIELINLTLRVYCEGSK